MVRKNNGLVIFCLMAIGFPSQIHPVKADGEAKDARYYRQQAMVAYQAKNYAAVAENLEKARALIPDHPTILYNLAIAYTFLGKTALALATLAIVARMGLIYPAARDSDFDSLKGNEEFK